MRAVLRTASRWHCLDSERSCSEETAPAVRESTVRPVPLPLSVLGRGGGRDSLLPPGDSCGTPRVDFQDMNRPDNIQQDTLDRELCEESLVVVG
uniref:Uncharacterized protein n=1 Tax=Knipowitschia caucasica TaxID=637954 RepID=A0AAV2LB13_KNICA